MTLRSYLTLAYLTVGLVFSALLGTSPEWRAAVNANARIGLPNWLTHLIQIAMLVGFGCLWPAVMLAWIFT